LGPWTWGNRDAKGLPKSILAIRGYTNEERSGGPAHFNKEPPYETKDFTKRRKKKVLISFRWRKEEHLGGRNRTHLRIMGTTQKKEQKKVSGGCRGKKKKGKISGNPKIGECTKIIQSPQVNPPAE